MSSHGTRRPVDRRSGGTEWSEPQGASPYEAAGILPAPRRTAAGYRVYGRDTLSFLVFVAQARRLGFRLEEIKEIVGIKRSGQVPCPHVHNLVRRKVKELDKALADLTEVRQRLRALLKLWRSGRRSGAVICPHIEHPACSRKRRNAYGNLQDVTLPGLQRVPRSRDPN